MARKGESAGTKTDSKASATSATPGSPTNGGGHADEANDEAEPFAGSVRARAGEAFDEISHELMASIDLQGKVDRNPYGVVAAALGVGFLLGGGLFSRFTGRLVGAGVRMAVVAALPALQKQLWAAALGELDQPENATDVTSRAKDDNDDEPASPDAT